MVDTSSGRRAKPFNLLWDEWEATKQPVQERANILPFGTYADGSTHLAFPGLLAMPFEGFARGQALSGHDIAANPEIGIPAAVDVAGGAMTGGFAATAAGAGERGALKVAEVPRFTAMHVSPHDFNQFDHSKVGTGIGANTEGRGLYLTDSERLIDEYASQFDTPFKYQAQINEDISKFLDWDTLPWETQTLLSSPEGVAWAKNEGIPGIIAKNTGKGFEGTQNYTIFPHANASVIHKWGPDGTQIYSNSNPSTSLALELAKDAANVPAQKGFTAYHGSPHDFDKFDMSKIGTGEGAQAYGHGLYFAENEGVARSYRNKLSAPPGQFDWMSMGNSKKYRFEALPGDGTPKFLDNNEISDLLSDPQYLKDTHNVSKFGVDSLRNDIAELERKRDAAMASAPEQSKAYYAEDYGRRIENKKRDLAREEGQAAELDALVRGGTKLKQGSMYEVRINADPNDFLDWDKPLSQQSEKVQKFASDRLPYSLDETGHAVVNGLSARLGRTKAAEELAASGIPGVRYLDQGSRTAGDGSRNYVLFRDDIIDIVKKYGVAYAAMMYGEDAVNSAMGTSAAASPGQTDY